MEDDEILTKCPHCGCLRLCNIEGEVCCTGCGAVLGNDYVQEQQHSEAKLNLYQATEVGTGKVRLECARRIHQPSSAASDLSNVCVKLDLPLYASQDARSIYQKVLRQRHSERIQYAARLRDLAELVKKGLAGEQEFAALKRQRPKGSTRAHTAVFAVHLVCKKYGLPRSDSQILEAVRMNFGIKRMFTVLKAYSLNEITAQELGIRCDCDKASYYVRLKLSKMQEVVGSGPLYDKIMRHAISNLQNISDMREDARASRAVELALRGAILHVQI